VRTGTGRYSVLQPHQSVYHRRVILFEASPARASRLIYGPNPFPEAVEVGSWLRSHTEPTDRIAVIGSEPQIYFYAGHRAATGYLYTYPMMEPQPFARQMQDEMMRELEAAMPAFVVFVSIPSSWLVRRDSDLAILDWANRFLQEHYQRVGVVEIRNDGGPSSYLWEEQSRGHRPRSSNTLLVWKRKPSAAPDS
jgi:hypothetical protein